MMKSGVFVVIVHFSDESNTVNCVQSLLKQTILCEGIVIVNNAIDRLIHPLLIDKCTVLDSVVNKGYAAACNLGIDYINQQFSAKYFWLLNNDVEIDSNCLENLLKCLVDDIGLLGSKILYFDERNVIQGVAGTYNKFLCVTKHVGQGKPANDYTDNVIEFDYPLGVSLFARNAFIKEVGKLDESYFLYFEELDWVFRAKQSNWKVAICTHALIYHKGGASIGARKENRKEKSALSDFYAIKSKLNFTKTHIPQYQIFLYLFFVFLAFEMLFRSKPKRIKMIFDLLINRHCRYLASRYE